MNGIEKLGKLMSKNMTLLVILVGMYSFFVPQTFKWVAPNMGHFLSVMMFGVGMTITKEQFKLVLKRPKDIFIGALAQFTIMPLVAIIIARMLNLSDELTLGLVLVGTCPGGVSSNVMTFLSKGDVALSVSLTTVSTFLAPIMTPIITLLLAGSSIDIEFASMFTSIVKTILLPIVMALLVSRYFPKVTNVMTKVLPLLSSVILMFLVSGSISGSIDQIKTSGMLIVVAVIMHHSLGHLFGYSIAKLFGLDESKRRAVSLEVGMQNSGLANTLAFAHFTPMVSVAAALSGPIQTIFSALLSNIWAKKDIEEIEINDDEYTINKTSIEIGNANN